MLRISNCECLAPDGVSISAPTPLWLREHCGRELGKNGRAGDGKECYAVLSSGHNMTAAHMNSKWLWISIQDKIKPVKSSSLEVGEAPEAPPLAEEGLEADGHQGREGGWPWVGSACSIQ